MSNAIRCLVLAAAVSLVACGRQSSDQQASAEKPAAESAEAAAQSQWPALTGQFIEAYFQAQPIMAVQAGRHEFDGRMPDWSREGIQKEVARLKTWREKVTGIDAAALSTAQQFERDYLLTVIDTDLFWLDRAGFPFRNPAWYIGQLDPAVYLSREYALPEKRLRGYIGYAKAVPQIAANIRANLKTPLPKSLVERAISGFGGYADFYRKDVPAVFAGVEDPMLRKEFTITNEAAAVAMVELKSWFESQLKIATNDYALGPEIFADMLKQTERVDTPLADLIAAGRADLQRNLTALRDACAKVLPGAPIPKCIDKGEARKPVGGPVVRGTAQLGELKAFVIGKDLVSIPGTEEALVKESPPYNRANLAYINIPGPYEKGLPSIYYVSPPDPTWSRKEQNAYVPGEARLLSTSVHEVWPGHFLQFLHSNRNPSKVQSLWVGYAFAEGWAHYTEELVIEAGLGGGDPELHVGQLGAALLRDVRYLSAIGLHTQGMTLAESEKMFVESAFADVGTARQQAARGTYDPGYLNYTLGKLMIRKLRTDWQAKNPDGKLRAFHDQFLSYGGPPVPLARKAMLGDSGPLL